MASLSLQNLMISRELLRDIRILWFGELLNRVWPALDIERAVVPGEPIPISWSIWTFNRELDLGDGYRVRVYLDEELLFQSPEEGEGYLPFMSDVPYVGAVDVKGLI